MRYRVGAALLLLAVTAASAAWASQPRSRLAAPTAPARALCGVERWTVKTLGDRAALLPLQPTTIAYLTTRRPPRWLPPTRLPFERHLFTVTAAVTLVRAESDGDYHVVLQDGAGRTMISEAPSSFCTSATPARRAQMATARARVRICARAKVTGVAFFDFYHGQTGVAPNAIELHPILAFRCLTASPSRGTPPPASGRVRLVSLTSPVPAGSDATLTVAVPTGTSCSIVVTYKSGPSSAVGLYPQRASGGRISWTWMVGTRTTPGRWPIDVSCDAAGSLHTSFVVS
jgi:hypothetical protein